jgi:adenylate cyclase
VAEARPARRLAAIVVADVAGYTRLMEMDESGTLDRFQAIMTKIVEPTTDQYQGRIVKKTGDGWLADFQSVTNAVLSSVDIQTSMSRRDPPLAVDRPLELRMGINLGEIIFEGDDIYGTGVNVAARLESIAEPGGICISNHVFIHVRGILDLEYEDLGPQTIKNIAEPIRAYALHAGKPSRPGGAAPSPTTARAALRHPSIAVLPFSNLSGDPSQEYFVDGMVEDIITALSRFKWLTVIARASTFAYKGKAVDVREFARDLSVRYVLEGSVQKSGNRVRLTGQLIDADTGAHLWADRFEGELEDVFDLQDRITEHVVSSLEPQIRRTEIARAQRKRPESLDAYDLFLRALPKAYAMRPEENAEALDLLEEAMRFDPEYAPAAAFASWCLEQRLTRGWPHARADDAAKAVKLARVSLAADTDDANAIAIAGFVLVMVGHDYDAGLAALARAVELNPNNAFVLMNAGWANTFAGDVGVALAYLERARSLSTRDPAAFFIVTGLAMTHLLSGYYEQAAGLASASAAIYEQWDATYFVLALAHAAAGRMEEAAAAVGRLIALSPGANIAHYPGMLPIRDPERRASLERLARRAGVPE